MLDNKSQSFFGPSNLVDLMRYRASIQPDDLAFVYLTDGVSSEIRLTYSELDRRCRALAAWLRRNNMRGKRALLLYPPGLDFIIAFYGCLYAGATAVPVYPPRRNRSMLRIQAISDSAEASLAMTTGDVLKRVATIVDETPNLKQLPWIATDEMTPGLEDEWVDPQIGPDEFAFFQYTSGSTGTPKGVMLSHANMLHNSMLIQTGFEHTRSSKGVFWLPSYHDMGLIGGVVQPVYCGCPNVMMSPLSFLQKPYRWLAAISKYRGTTSGGPNFAYDLCVKSIKDEQLETLDLSSWKVAFNGAEPVQAETLEQFAKKFEPCGFKYESFYPCFGLAEGTLLVTGGARDQAPVTRDVDADALAAGKAVDAIAGSARVKTLVSSGRMVVDQRVVVVDPETRLECPAGQIGEIWTKSGSVAKGYWRNEAETERAFRAHIADTNEGPFLRTGDLGFMVDGELFVTGRIKDLIIIRGVNVYPQDVELTAQHVSPLLRLNNGGAFMIGEFRKEKLVLVQEVERRFKKEDAPQIFSEIRKAIALEHEIPIDAIVLIRSGSLPKTSSGKVQRHACRASFLAGELEPIASWSLEEATLATTAPAAGAKTGFGSFRAEENPLYVDEQGKFRADESADVSGDAVAGWEATRRDLTNVLAVTEKKNEKTDVKATEQSAEKGENASSACGPVSYDETVKIVLDEVYRVAKERARDLTIDSDITELGLDSLERMEILAALEDRFGGQFPEHVLPTLFTAREVVDAVRKHLGGGRVFETEETKKTYEIDESCYDFAKFPEYLAMHEKVELANRLGLSHFFEPHEDAAGATTTINGKEYINFSSYNYIGSSGHPSVVAAAQEAVATYGTTAGASRIVAGEIPLHQELEGEITKFLGTEDTIVFVGGHQTNESVIGHLMGAEDLILHDSLAHNSIVQGCILSGARRRPFPHGDWDAVDKILSQHRGKYRRVLIALEGVYSMDGDYPDLPEFIRVRNKYKTLLMVDEAHSIGVLGETGRGVGEHFGVNRRDVDLWMCTLSKTFGSCGGYISGRKELVEYLKYTAPAFMFSVGMPPAAAAAAIASLRLLQREPGRAAKLRENSAYFKKLARGYGMDVGLAEDTGVVPVIVGNSIHCLKASHMLFLNGVNAHPILHPAVEERHARIRFFLTSEHTREQIKTTVDMLAGILQQVAES
ncbi:MAG: aminotransferase class I/II-fold pyridoxal phosphate-dependent enzyme [Thermoguttaceae bacterium]|nr:aminotransferase class I/II-fold pyridoxal phosphate-dependent enzyme [Thermoguttaceae bacterium]